jgi:4-amino-4-deoxy-L-arabinose transferase-like glycosyltransferase
MKTLLPGLVITLVFFFITLFTLSDYGMNEDSPFHFLRGQYYLQKLTTGGGTFGLPKRLSPVLFAPGQRISLYKPNASEEFLAPRRSIATLPSDLTLQEEFRKILEKLDRRESFYKHDAWGANVWDFPGNETHPPVSDTLMAATNRIFYEKMGILGDVEAYHLYIVITSTISLFFVYVFTQKAFSTMAAIFASATLALFPFYFAESHFNIKDPVQMSYFTLAITSFYFFIASKLNLRWFIVFIIATFLALGTKWNIAFLPIIVLPWLLFIVKKKEIRNLFSWRKTILYGILAIVLPFVLLIAAWPFLWIDPIPKLLNTFGFYAGLAVKNPQVDVPSPFPLPLGFNATAILRVISMTPPATLFLFAVGLSAIVGRRIKTKFSAQWLVVLWLLMPILRVSRQWADTAGSIRQFIEYLPAFAIITGLGASFILTKIERFFKSPKILTYTNLYFSLKNINKSIQLNFQKILFCLGLSLYILILTSNIIRLHPNQNVYFNFLVRGLPGARDRRLFAWQGTYDNIYRQGVAWFNEHAPKNAKLAYLDGTMLAISPLWLRDDIRFGSYFSGFKQNGEYIISIVYPLPPSVFGYNYLERFLNPLYTRKVDNVALLKIWQNDPKKTKPQWEEQRQLSDWQIRKLTLEGKRAWEINLRERKKVTRLILRLPENCTNTKGVWSTIYNGKENFLNPQELILEKEKMEIDFPGEEGETIRFWDIEGNSCLYQGEVESIYAL